MKVEFSARPPACLWATRDKTESHTAPPALGVELCESRIRDELQKTLHRTSHQWIRISYLRRFGRVTRNRGSVLQRWPWGFERVIILSSNKRLFTVFAHSDRCSHVTVQNVWKKERKQKRVFWKVFWKYSENQKNLESWKRIMFQRHIWQMSPFK